MNMKAHSLLILCALAMLAGGCTTKQPYIQEDNPLGYGRQDIIDMFEFCCHQIDVSGEDLTTLLTSLRIPTE